VVLAAGLLALYVGLRAGPAAGLPTYAEALAVAGGLTAAVAAAGVWLTRRRYRAVLAELSRRVASCRGAPSPSALQAGAEPGWAAGEWAPLCAEVEALAACYRQALGEVVKTQEALERLRAFGVAADAEKGHSHSFVHQSGFLRSSRLIARLTPSLHWMAATAALQRFLGRPMADLNGRPFLECAHPDDAPALARPFQEALQEGEAHDVTFRVLVRGEEVRHLQMDVLTRYTEAGAPLHLRCHFVDVTDRVRAERELRLQSAKLARTNALLRQTNEGLQRLKESYRDLYHQAPVLYFSLDPRGHFAACNDTMLAALGYAREDLLGQPYTRLLLPDGARRFLQDPDAYQRPGEVEARWVKKDGTAIDVWVRTAPLVDEGGRFVRSRSAAQDVTERNRLANAVRAKAEELQQANERLRRINQELEEFTYVVSHDLKEPLRTLEAFSTFLRQDYGESLGEQGREYINHLVAASRRLGGLIDDLLALSRAGKVINTPRAFDLREALDTAVADLADLIQRKGAAVRVEAPLPAVVGDPERVTQLLTNLISNGLKYNASERPEVVVGFAMDGFRFSMEEARGETTAPAPGGAGDHRKAKSENRKAMMGTFSVRDNGIGIAAQYHEQIFRLFRRLHRREEYEGSGAGLAICKKIVEAHGGRLWVESEPGRGATFLFTLPLAAARAPAAPAAGVNGGAAPAAANV
jgi:PAS domain S-box-containing protein